MTSRQAARGMVDESGELVGRYREIKSNEEGSMKYLKAVFLSVFVLVMAVGTANAWHVSGQVICPNGSAFFDVKITVTGTRCDGSAFSRSAFTDAAGGYLIGLPSCPGSFTISINMADLPADAVVVSPAGGSTTFSTTSSDNVKVVNFVVDSAECEPQAACWFTGGGAKIDPLLGIPVGQKGKWINFGGNVNPGCSPTAGDGGNWNHIDRLANLHFQGRTIQVTDCGNVTPPPPPGSTSPVTPFNYIEWTGVGTVKGIQGNKTNLEVYFNARTEDRNEPGSKDSNAGSGIDRYYLHVFTDPADPVGSTVLLVNGDANPLNVVPVEIDHGNFQIHVSSCDDPPTP
jgi:hypothetical protein